MSGMEKEAPCFGHFDEAWKTKKPPESKGFKWLRCGAAIQIRTGDLILTKDALYQLSYISIRVPASESH